MKRMLLVCVGVCLFAVAAAGEEAGKVQPGRYDEQAVRLLREATAVLKPDTTTLAEVAPQYAVVKGEALLWDDAVEKADRLFGGDVDRRALFLRKFLPEGSPAERLGQLRLPKMGLSWGTGSGQSVSYGIGVTYPEQGGVPGSAASGTPTNPLRVRMPKAKATITFWVGRDRTVGSPTLQIEDVEVGGAHYRLSFDVYDRLRGFQRQVVVATPSEATLSVGASGPGYFTVGVTPKNGVREELAFGSDLVMKTRRIRDPETGKALYTETYEKGKLRRRSWYGERKTGGGTQSFIERTEEF